MTDTNETKQATPAAAAKPAATLAAKPAGGNNRGNNRGSQGGRGNNRSGGGRGRRRPGGRPKREVKEFEQKILDLSRVTRVTAGGKRMRFRAALVIGDGKGRVGFGLAKGTDVAMSIEKAYRQAKKNVVTIPLSDETFPHEVRVKAGAAQVLLKPAPKGTGLKSGGAIRVMLEMAGVPNATSKILGSSNKINIARATMKGLRTLRTRKEA